MKHKKTYKTIGAFTTESLLMVTDPCYKGGDLEIKDALPGKWNCFVVLSDEGYWGVRVAELHAIHKKYKGEAKNRLKMVSVDSGQMGIFAKRNTDYNDICNLTSPAGICDTGVVSSTGFGDGGYQVYSNKNSKQKTVAIKIKFI